MTRTLQWIDECAFDSGVHEERSDNRSDAECNVISSDRNHSNFIDDKLRETCSFSR